MSLPFQAVRINGGLIVGGVAGGSFGLVRTAADDVEFAFVNVGQMAVSLGWFRIVDCDIFVLGQKFGGGCEFNGVLLGL